MTPAISDRPGKDEAADHYSTYINQVPEGDIRDTLQFQLGETLGVLQGIDEERSLHRYAEDKWTIKEVVSHINDTERVFGFRALWFARGFQEPLPSFDQNIAMAGAAANERTFASHVDEFRAVRVATVSFFQSLPAAAWTRHGIASGNPFTVRALAYIAAGHVAHHLRIVRERYL